MVEGLQGLGFRVPGILGLKRVPLLFLFKGVYYKET